MKKERWRGLIIAGAILLIGLGYEAYQSYLRNLPQDYTIGIIKKVGPAAKGGDVISYIYWIKDKKYNRFIGLPSYEDSLKIGDRFLVEYPKGHPGKGVMLLDKPVPDSVVAPKDGWEEIPDFARSE